MFISVEAVRWVFTNSQAERSARLVLVAIATHCNDDGYCWPGHEAIMRYTKLSKPIVIQAIEKLVEINEITVEKGGRGPGDTNHYYLSAFMESRVRMCKEISDKGKVTHSERVNTGLHEERTLEYTLEERRHRDLINEAIRESQRTGEAADEILKRLRHA